MQPFAGRDVDQWRSEEARAPGVGDTASPGSHVVCCAWLNSSWDTIGGNAFGALTAVSGSLRPQTLVPLRRSGVGRERKAVQHSTAALLTFSDLSAFVIQFTSAFYATFNGPRCLSLSCLRKVSDVPALLFPSSSIHSTSPVSRHIGK